MKIIWSRRARFGECTSATADSWGGEMIATVDTRIIKLEAAELLDEYVQCLDDDRLEEWPEFFIETGVYKIVSRENVERNLPIATMLCTSKGMMKDRVVAIRKASVYSPR